MNINVVKLKILNEMMDSDIPASTVKSRFNHCCRVADISESMATAFGGLDVDISYCAGLMHDIAKYKVDQNATNREHAILGSTYVKKLLFNDFTLTQIYHIEEAIYYHSDKLSKSNIDIYSKILIDADIIDKASSFKFNEMYKAYYKQNKFEDFINYYLTYLDNGKNMLRTVVGKDMFEERHKNMLKYIKGISKR